MDSPFWGGTRARVFPQVGLLIALALSVGCAGYSRQPLLLEEYRHALGQRTPEKSSIVDAVNDANYQPGNGLSLAEAELLALYLNPDLRAARAAAGVPEAAAQFAGLWDDPEVGFDALRILDSVDEPWIYGASLSFTIPISGRLSIARAAAAADARVALIEAWSAEQTTLLSLRTAWADWKEVSELLAVSQDLHERVTELVAITNQREALGELITAEAVAFRLAEARLAMDVDRLSASRQQARIDIHSLLGLLPEADVTFVATDSEIAPRPSGELGSSPQVLLAGARYEGAEQRLRLEVRKQYPDLTIGPLFENEEGLDRVGLGFSLPIPLLNRNRQGIAEAKAARDHARAEWERAVEYAISKLARNRAKLDAAQRHAAMLESAVVPLADLQLAEARRLAELGEINTLLILEALQASREASLELIEARAEVARAAAELRAITPERAPFADKDAEEAQP